MRRNAVPVITEEGRFASTGEYARWKELELLARGGVISNVERQPKFPLVINGQPVVIRTKKSPNGRKCVYTADAAYDENGVRVVEDFKGYDTDIARLRRAVVEAIYGIRIEIITKRGSK